MRKIFVIAQREISAMVATKAFLFTLVMMPILMLGGVVLMPMLSKLGGGKHQKILVIDGTGQLFGPLKAIADARSEMLDKAAKSLSGDESTKTAGGSNQGMGGKENYYDLEMLEGPIDNEMRLELSKKIRETTIYAFVEIPSNLIENTEATVSNVSFVAQDAFLSGTRGWIANTLPEIVRSIRLDRLGVDQQLVAKASLPIKIDPRTPYQADETGNIDSTTNSNVIVTIFLPFGVMMLMFLVIFLAAQPMLESGMEEKSQRIAEVLLGSVSPMQLMSGKLIGNVLGSLLIFAIYGIGGWYILDVNGWTKLLPWSLLPWFIVFQLLGVVFFSSVFLTIGAAINDLKEAQSMMLPVWLVLMAPMMVWFVAMREPNGLVATSLSFFPPSTPLMMILRLSTGQSVPAWQPPLAVIVLLVATSVVVYLAGRIYRVSLLRTDSARSFRLLLSRLRGA